VNNDARRILILSNSDQCGGAEKMAWDLFQAYRARGLVSFMVVGEKHSHNPHVYVLPKSRPGPWFRGWRGLNNRLRSLADRHAMRTLEALVAVTSHVAQPGKWFDRVLGHDDFRFPNTYQLLEQSPARPDVIHCHNLHGGFFDLRALPWLSRQAPVVLSLHDSWLLSGLCGHPFDCERWKVGCGHCPYLSTWQEPAWSTRDGTAYNWRRKKKIFAQCRLHVTTACQWLMNKVRQSILAPAVKDARVIPYGVDLHLFQPGDRLAAREKLGIPADALILLTIARTLVTNPSKDYPTLRKAMILLAARHPKLRIILIARGEARPTETQGNSEIRYEPWTSSAADIVHYYHAADIYVHVAKMDTFPLSILEAQACGIPVVASAVGGIPEQVRSLVAANAEIRSWEADKATGVLAPPGDHEALVSAIERLALDHGLRSGMGANAARLACSHFDLNRQVQAYLDWYAELAAPAVTQVDIPPSESSTKVLSM
jgi:glycosyltransferase involved in cell wall biosynthesis